MYPLEKHAPLKLVWHSKPVFLASVDRAPSNRSLMFLAASFSILAVPRRMTRAEGSNTAEWRYLAAGPLAFCEKAFLAFKAGLSIRARFASFPAGLETAELGCMQSCRWLGLNSNKLQPPALATPLGGQLGMCWLTRWFGCQPALNDARLRLSASGQPSVSLMCFLLHPGPYSETLPLIKVKPREDLPSDPEAFNASNLPFKLCHRSNKGLTPKSGQAQTCDPESPKLPNHIAP